MAGLTPMPETRQQFAAIALVRWQLFLHSLRTTRGTTELVSRILIGIVIVFAGVGGAIGLGAAAWAFVSKGTATWLALLLWSIFLFWQLFPVMATAFTESTDSTVFLRFPLSYRAYVVTMIVYGAFDIATALGSMWLCGILIGITIADITLALWSALVLIIFALVNILLARTIFTWIERWLAQRRTREIMGVFFFLLVIGLQFIGPLMSRYGKSSKPGITQFGQELSPAQRISPPGVAAQAISLFHEHRLGSAGYLGLLAAYGATFIWLLHIRLRAQYLGESWSETAASNSSRPQKQSVRPGWRIPGLPAPIIAILEKELRYLSRSGPVLFTLVMPAVMLAVFRFGGSGRSGGGVLEHAPNFAFPIGAAYAVLVLTNLVYNNFGADGGGIQFLFASPVRFRQVVLAKNLAHTTVLLMELLLVWLSVVFLHDVPPVNITAATLAGILFVVPVNLAAGNLLSIYSPKKIEYGTFGRQRAAQTTVLISFIVQIFVSSVVAFLFLSASRFGGYWGSALVLAILAAIAFAGYLLVLGRVDRLALQHQEDLISELCRA